MSVAGCPMEIDNSLLQDDDDDDDDEDDDMDGGGDLSLVCSKVANNDPSLTFLEFYGDDLRDEGDLLVLVTCLRNNSHVTSLALHGCSVGKEAMLALNETLRVNRHLRLLTMNQVSGVGPTLLGPVWQSLAQQQQPNEGLESICLEETSMGADGCQFIDEFLRHNQTVRDLNLAKNRLGIEGGLAIARGLPHNNTLHLLSLSLCQLTNTVGRELLRAIGTNRYLLQVDLGGNLLDDELAPDVEDMLRRNKTLKQISFTLNHFGPPTAQAIVSALKPNECPNNNNNNNNKYNYNTTLTGFSLGANRLGQRGAEILGKGLPEMKSIIGACLMSNNFGEEGVRHLVDGLEKSKSIVKLNIGALNDMDPSLYHAARFYERRNEIAWKILEGDDANDATTPHQRLWPYIFSKLHRDPDMIFFLVKERPSLFLRTDAYN